MEAPFCLVDAFSPKRFGGNPAAVVELVDWHGQEEWPPEFWMQAVAAEFNLSETAFLKGSPVEEAHFDLRWFTPTVEVALCGHATLASVFALATDFLKSRPPEARTRLVFATKSGLLPVTHTPPDTWTLDFPADEANPAKPPAALRDGLGVDAQEWRRGHDDWMAVLATEDEVQNLQPDFARLAETSKDEGGIIRGLIATAPGNWGGGADFVSRFFAPWSGIDEDPVTGSAHCTLTPYWAQRLGKTAMTARQISARGGRLNVANHGGRVHFGGQCALIAHGHLGRFD